MIAAMVIVFREVLEASLIIGIVLSATRGLPMVNRWVSAGVLAGLIGSVVVARFAGVISDAFTGHGEDLFNATVLLIAVTMLTWHNVWMSTQGRRMIAELKSVGESVRSGGQPLYALSIVVGLGVLREGSEAVLFIYGLAISDGGFADAILGGAAGLVVGALVGTVLYFGLVRIPTRHLFNVTSWLITLLAAGMAAQAMSYLAAAGFFSLGDTLWDSSFLLSQKSIPGKILHTLVGYMDRPTVVQMIAYIGTITMITFATRWASARECKAA